MNRYRRPKSEKERNLQQVRSRLGGTTLSPSRPKSSGNPGVAMLGLSTFFITLHLGIGALLTGKSAFQMAAGLSQILGQSPLLSALMGWMSVIGLGAVLHGFLVASNSKQD